MWARYLPETANEFWIDLKKQGHSWNDKWSFRLFVILLCFLPLPFGSVTPFWLAFFLAIAGLSGLLSSFRKTSILPLLVLVFCVGCFVAAAVMGIHQLRSAPFEEGVKQLWDMVAPFLPNATPAGTLNKGATFLAIGTPLLLAMMLLLGVSHASDRERSILLIKVIAYSGLCYAVLTALMLFFYPQRLLWIEKVAYRGFLTGTFVNRNTAATYFGMAFIAYYALLWRRIEKMVGGKSWTMREIVSFIIARIYSPFGFRIAGLFFLLMALLMTGSRAGVVLSLFSLIVFTMMMVWRHNSHKITMLQGVWLGGLLTAMVLVSYLVGGGFADSMNDRGVADGGRAMVITATSELIQKAPIRGYGIRTFEDVFPKVRPQDLGVHGVWDKTHNTLVELAYDSGIYMAGMAFLASCIVFLVLLWGVKSRKRDYFIPGLSASVFLLASTHSLVDFSLQIPGFAGVLMALLGCGLSQSVSVNGNLKAEKQG